MKVIAAVADSDIKRIATRVLQFIRNRFTTAVGTPTDHGFSFVLDDQHVATVAIGKNYVELEAGPDRVGSGKIRDVAAPQTVTVQLGLRAATHGQ